MGISAQTCRLEIKAVPNAPKSEVVGWLGEALKVKVHAPPVEGKANEELCSFLAETLGLPKRAVQLDRGASSRKKIVMIEGLTLEEVSSRLFP
jgi:uncharacterized protein (TIGR00251 family)